MKTRNKEKPEAAAVRKSVSADALFAAFKLLDAEREAFYRSTAAAGADECDSVFPQETEWREMRDLIDAIAAANGAGTRAAAREADAPPPKPVRVSAEDFGADGETRARRAIRAYAQAVKRFRELERREKRLRKENADFRRLVPAAFAAGFAAGLASREKNDESAAAPRALNARIPPAPRN